VCPVLTCRRPNWQGQEFFARRVDAWPATPKDNLCAHTFIHASVFVQWERMQFLCRAASLASYLKLLEAEGADYGNQVRARVRPAFLPWCHALSQLHG
jgi:hypothetical protein